MAQQQQEKIAESFIPSFEWLQNEAKKAKELLVENKFVEAENLMCEVNKQALILFNNDDLALGMAEFYYLYGTILVNKIGQNLDVFGDRVREVEIEALGEDEQVSNSEERGAAMHNDGDIIREENDIDNGYGEERKTQGQTTTIVEEQVAGQPTSQARVEDLDDFKVAWENLESARVILEKNYDQQKEKQFENSNNDHTYTRNLAKVLIRLAELEQWRDNFDAAMENIKKALELRLQIENKEASRDLAECYFLIGNVLLYNYREGCESLALEQYKQALQILENNLASELQLERKDVSGILEATEAPSMSHLKESFMDLPAIKELKQVITMLYEKIEDVKIALKEVNSEEYRKLKQEMEQMKQQQGTTQVFSNQNQQPAQPVVNLGNFGNAIKRSVQEEKPQEKDKDKENNDGNKEKVQGEEPTKRVKYD